MSKIGFGTGKRPTVADLEHDAKKIETNLEVNNKQFIKKMVHILRDILSVVPYNEDGIFNVLLKWFRLYLKLRAIINQDDRDLLMYYEKCVPLVTTYIIGCLQYKGKDVPNYHYNLLEILEELIENVQPRILREVTKFEPGTIACLWNSIDLAGDFNTQLKALKILSFLLIQFDEKKQNEELKYIKWTNLNFFQENLKAIVQQRKYSNDLENCSRELLNNYNMNFKKELMVYSFYCKSVIIGNKYKFYKPVHLKKFWVDINYCPKTISYSGRFQLNSNSNYENINVTLKIQQMTLEKNTLRIHFEKECEIFKYSHYLPNSSNNVIEFTLTREETRRLIKNDFIMEYFNKNKKCENRVEKKSKFDLLKNEMPKSIKGNECQDEISLKKNLTVFESSQRKNIADTLSQSPKIKAPSIRNLRKRKLIFPSLPTEDPCKKFHSKSTTKKKRLQKRKTRRVTRTPHKKICKVTPTVDLTKFENADCGENIIKSQCNDNVLKNINTQVCDAVLKEVADIYDPDYIEYAKPCQSYRNFQTQLSPIANISRGNAKSKWHKKKINVENESSVEKRRKIFNNYSQENKENINPENVNIIDKYRRLPKAKRILSPHLFETHCSDEIPSANNFSLINKYKNKGVQYMMVDLTENEIEKLTFNEHSQDKKNNSKESILCSGALDCEEVRGLEEINVTELDYICTPTKYIVNSGSKVTTPRPTSSMNISVLNDSDMETKQEYNPKGRLQEQSQMYCKDNCTNQDALDMELTQPFYIDNKFENDEDHIPRFQTGQDLFLEDIHVIPEQVQQIVNDFEPYSGNELCSSCKICATKDAPDITRKHMNNHQDCIIFQNRKNIEGFTDEDDADSICDEVGNFSDFLKCNQITTQNLITKRTIQSSGNQNICQENYLHTSPEKNSEISENCISTIATRYKVTPTAVILHQVQVSSKKSIILRNEKSKKGLKSNKCLNNYFGDNSNSAKFQREVTGLQTGNLNNSKNANSTTCFTKTFERRNTYRPNKLQLQRILENHTISNNTNDHLSETTISNQTPKLLHSENGVHLLQQPSSINTSLIKERKNSAIDSNEYKTTHQNSKYGDLKSLFKKDLLHIIEDYDKNMQVRSNNAMKLLHKSISDKYTHKFLEITNTFLKKCDENRMEFEQIRFNIGRLMRELQCEYDAFVNKSKEFDIHRDVMGQLMETVTNINTSNYVTKDYEDIMKTLQNEQNELFQKLCKKYLDRLK